MGPGPIGGLELLEMRAGVERRVGDARYRHTYRDARKAVRAYVEKGLLGLARHAGIVPVQAEKPTGSTGLRGRAALGAAPAGSETTRAAGFSRQPGRARCYPSPRSNQARRQPRLRQNQFMPSKNAVTQRCSPPRKRMIGCDSPQ